jgi:hypothetical protein
MYLAWWDFAIEPKKGRLQICKQCDGEPGNFETSDLDEKARTVHGKYNLTENEKGETGQQQSQELLSTSSKGLFIKNSSCQTKQSIPHTTVALHGDYVKMWEDLAANFGDERTGSCIMTKHRLIFPFSLVIFLLPKTTDSRPPPTLVAWLGTLRHFSVFSIEHITEIPSFWHSWVYRGRISCCSEHPHDSWTSRMNLKIGRSSERRMGPHRGWRCPIDSKLVSFWPGSTSTRNYGWLFVCLVLYAYKL